MVASKIERTLGEKMAEVRELAVFFIRDTLDSLENGYVDPYEAYATITQQLDAMRSVCETGEDILAGFRVVAQDLGLEGENEQEILRSLTARFAPAAQRFVERDGATQNGASRKDWIRVRGVARVAALHACSPYLPEVRNRTGDNVVLALNATPRQLEESLALEFTFADSPEAPVAKEMLD